MPRERKITGKVFTKLFQNEENCDLNCIIQVPKSEVFLKIRELLTNVDATTKLSADSTLSKIIEMFSKNAYTNSGAGTEKKEAAKKGEFAIPVEFESHERIAKN